MKTIKVTLNTWGNFCGYIGTERVETFDGDYDAKYWLCKQLLSGQYKLSSKSYFQESDVEYIKELFK